MRFALVALAACGAPPAAPLSSHVAPVAPTPLAPVIVPHVADAACPLSWSELDEVAPPRIPLAGTNDSCPELFDPEALLAACALPDCEQGTMRGNVRAALAIDGPNGSGHFFTLALAVAGGHSTCMMASTVGWRLLSPVITADFGALPWLADIDHDGSAELVVWHRLPWGDAEVDNALYPVVYVLDGDALVRRDDRGVALRAKVAAKYRELANRHEHDDPAACLAAVVRALTPPM